LVVFECALLPSFVNAQVEEYVSALPFLPPLTEQTLNQYYR
jgi:hypothetical protein